MCSLLSCAGMDLSKKKIWDPFFATDQKHSWGEGRMEMPFFSEQSKILNQLPFPSFPIHDVQLKIKIF